MALRLPQLLDNVRACRVCEDLPLGPRPVVAVGEGARVVIIGQAPGTKVHASGVPWQDASGDHLREWLELDEAIFYDSAKVAIVPMGFCYPGRRGGGDAPPRRECAPRWHAPLLEAVADDALLLLVGQYAQKHYLRSERKKSLTKTVEAFEAYAPRFLPLPHPSWRSRHWMKKNPWFAARVLPALRERVHASIERASLD